MKDKYVKECQFCGNKDFIMGFLRGHYQGYAQFVSIPERLFFSNDKERNVCFVVCKSCGSVVRTFFDNPQGLPEYDAAVTFEDAFKVHKRYFDYKDI